MNSNDLYDDEKEPKVDTHSTIYRVVVPGVHVSELLVYVNIHAGDGYAEMHQFRWFGVSGPLHGGYNMGNPEHLKNWETQREIWSWLCEWELIESRQIGPEDSEYFATTHLTGE